MRQNRKHSRHNQQAAEPAPLSIISERALDAMSEVSGVTTQMREEMEAALRKLEDASEFLAEKRDEPVLMFTSEILKEYVHLSGRALQEKHKELLRRIGNRVRGLREDIGQAVEDIMGDQSLSHHLQNKGIRPRRRF